MERVKREGEKKRMEEEEGKNGVDKKAALERGESYLVGNGFLFYHRSRSVTDSDNTRRMRVYCLSTAKAYRPETRKCLRGPPSLPSQYRFTLPASPPFGPKDPS